MRGSNQRHVVLRLRCSTSLVRGHTPHLRRVAARFAAVAALVTGVGGCAGDLPTYVLEPDDALTASLYDGGSPVAETQLGPDSPVRRALLASVGRADRRWRDDVISYAPDTRVGNGDVTFNLTGDLIVIDGERATDGKTFSKSAHVGRDEVRRLRQLIEREAALRP